MPVSASHYFYILLLVQLVGFFLCQYNFQLTQIISMLFALLIFVCVPPDWIVASLPCLPLHSFPSQYLSGFHHSLCPQSWFLERQCIYRQPDLVNCESFTRYISKWILPNRTQTGHSLVEYALDNNKFTWSSHFCDCYPRAIRVHDNGTFCYIRFCANLTFLLSIIYK